MKKRNTPQRIILKLREGSLTDQGFSASIESGEEGSQPTERNEGHLPAHPEILEVFSKWQTAFEIIAGVRRIEPKCPPQTFSCEESADVLKKSLNDWLNRGDREEWRKIRDFLMTQATKHNVEEGKGEVTRIIVQTNDSELWQLPWSALDLSRLGIKAEIAFSLSEWKGKTERLPKGTKVRILVVLGNSGNLDTDFDRQLLQATPHAKITVLKQPSKAELLEQLRSDAGWHIFFFAGHSGTVKEEHIGQFEINEEEILTIEDLKNCFTTAIENGLQLAIFNSCDGVGLAKQLAELNLPQSIVMRLPVPDEVAKKFLQLFLERFAKQGKSLYAAVYETRGILEDEFKQYPGVGWLPMLCQNPAVVAGSWEEWTRIPKVVWFGVFLVTTATVISLASWLYQPFLLDELLTPLKVEISSANYIAFNDETRQQKPLAGGKLYSKDQYRIEITNNAKTDRYIYAYQLSNTKNGLEILDLMKLFDVAHYIGGQQEWVILPPSNNGLEITGEAGTEKICVLAFQQTNLYLDGLSVDHKGHVTGHQKLQYIFFRDVNNYLEEQCSKETSGMFTFKSMGERKG
jgi:hypothetical protein